MEKKKGEKSRNDAPFSNSLLNEVERKGRSIIIEFSYVYNSNYGSFVIPSMFIRNQNST